MEIERTSLRLREEGIVHCLATLVKVEGSAPRHAGTKMIITADAIFGTIGGGSLEQHVIEDARLLLTQRSPQLKSYTLEKDHVQPCGGTVEIFFEPVQPSKEMIVFGAGHIAEKLCPMLGELGYKITLIDERAERVELPAFQVVSKRIAELPSAILPQLSFHEELHIICITHQHLHDEEIVRFCLEKPYRYLGLISSRKKWALFCEQFRQEGFSEKSLARVSTPIGLDIGAESPFEISIAIAAQLMQLHAKPDDFRRGVAHFRRNA